MLAAQITAARDAAAKKTVPKVKPLAERIADALDFRAWSALTPEADKILSQVAADGGMEGLIQVDVDTPAITEQVNEDAVRWAKERAAELVGMRYADDGTLEENPDAEWAITESTRDMLRTDIERAIVDGTTTDELAGQLAQSHAFSRERAERIARTEVAKADVQGNLAAYRRSGVVEGKEWILGSEHNDTDECDDAEAMGVVPLDSDFGGVGDPPAHPNCTCDIVPVLTAK